MCVIRTDLDLRYPEDVFAVIWVMCVWAWRPCWRQSADARHKLPWTTRTWIRPASIHPAAPWRLRASGACHVPTPTWRAARRCLRRPTGIPRPTWPAAMCHPGRPWGRPWALAWALEAAWGSSAAEVVRPTRPRRPSAASWALAPLVTRTTCIAPCFLQEWIYKVRWIQLVLHCQDFLSME